MPTYVYQCPACNRLTELYTSTKDAPDWVTCNYHPSAPEPVHMQRVVLTPPAGIVRNPAVPRRAR